MYICQSQMRQALVCCTCVFAGCLLCNGTQNTEMVGSSIDTYTVFTQGRAELRIACGIPCLRFLHWPHTRIQYRPIKTNRGAKFWFRKFCSRIFFRAQQIVVSNQWRSYFASFGRIWLDQKGYKPNAVTMLLSKCPF